MKTIFVVPSSKGPDCPDTARLFAALCYKPQSVVAIHKPGSPDAEALWTQLGIVEANRKYPLLVVQDGVKVARAMEPTVEEIGRLLGEPIDGANIPMMLTVTVTRRL